MGTAAAPGGYYYGDEKLILTLDIGNSYGLSQMTHTLPLLLSAR